jgi:PmbA protein
VYFENGILKNYLLSDFGARKLKEKRSVSSGTHLVIDTGETEFLKMVKSIKKGLLVARFSGGHPADNGDFSGVAKNSYYIENGEIVFPVSEVMISGNYSQLIQNIGAVSKESINFGDAKFPWVHFSGVTVS